MVVNHRNSQAPHRTVEGTLPSQHTLKNGSAITNRKLFQVKVSRFERNTSNDMQKVKLIEVLVLLIGVAVAHMIYTGFAKAELPRSHIPHINQARPFAMAVDLPDKPWFLQPSGKYINLGYKFDFLFGGEWVGLLTNSGQKWRAGKNVNDYVTLNDNELQTLLKTANIDALPPVPKRPFGIIFFDILFSFFILALLTSVLKTIFYKAYSIATAPKKQEPPSNSISYSPPASRQTANTSVSRADNLLRPAPAVRSDAEHMRNRFNGLDQNGWPEKIGTTHFRKLPDDDYGMFADVDHKLRAFLTWETRDIVTPIQAGPGAGGGINIAFLAHPAMNPHTGLFIPSVSRYAYGYSEYLLVTVNGQFDIDGTCLRAMIVFVDQDFRSGFPNKMSERHRGVLENVPATTLAEVLDRSKLFDAACQLLLSGPLLKVAKNLQRYVKLESLELVLANGIYDNEDEKKLHPKDLHLSRGHLNPDGRWLYERMDI
jgi:hypothetical protein